jgi:hypothetical protein
LDDRPGQKRNTLRQPGLRNDLGPHLQVVRHGILHAEVAFLQKPFNIDALAKKIRDLLDQR